jgi:hypothetical protein
MALYAKDKRFSMGWVLGGTVIMLITNLLAGLLAGMMGVRSLVVLTGIAVGCFAFGGFIIGWKSEGRTILEAGLAAALATGVSLAIRYFVMHQGIAGMEPAALAIGLGIPFLAGLLGGWIGEKVQGETVGSDG